MIFRLLALGLVLAAPSAAETPLDTAMALARNRQYSEARAVLEKLLAAEPGNAAACHGLGLLLKLNSDLPTFEGALKWLEKSTQLEPANAAYLADYGGTMMEYAGRIQSTSKLKAISAATTGRDLMEKSLTINPDNLDARFGLLQFYAQAPWPIGSSSKAYAQAAEIRRRDATRGLLAFIGLKVGDKKYDEAFALCEEALKTQPDNYVALQQIGRTAAVSGQNIDRGIAALQKCLTLPPPPNAVGYPGIQYRLGTLWEKKGNVPAARAAYEAALKLDPNYKQAASALAKLK